MGLRYAAEQALGVGVTRPSALGPRLWALYRERPWALWGIGLWPLTGH